VSTDDSTDARRGQTSPEAREGLQMLRRMPVKLSGGATWQVLGHRLLNGKREVRNPEQFSGVGFFARPHASHKVDSLVAFPGGAQNPIIAATRDEDLRKLVAADLDQDEAMMANTVAVVYLKKTGSAEIRSPSGAARRLAFADELNDLRAFVVAQFSGAGHVHGVSGGATNSTTPVGSAPSSYPGTGVLKGE
jgi:hypothetical protein